jgi:protein gp37
MGENTKIEWAEHSWSPWHGCLPKHIGCVNCYAQDYFRRFGIDVTKVRRRASDSTWKKPHKWNREAGRDGTTPIVFPSLMDPFERWDGPILNAKGRRLRIDAPGHYTTGEEYAAIVPGFATMADLRRDFFDLIDQTPNLTWCLLTKRPENIQKMWCDSRVDDRDYRDNVYLLYSASDQESLEAGLPHLLACRDLVPVIGLSLEPLVAPIRIPVEVIAQLGWVLVGGESGPNARPCQVEWIRDIVERCREAGVACFVKQLGRTVLDRYAGCRPANIPGWPLGTEMIARAGDVVPCGVRLKHPKGGDPSEWPEELRVQQYPEVSQ